MTTSSKRTPYVWFALPSVPPLFPPTAIAVLNHEHMHPVDLSRIRSRKVGARESFHSAIVCGGCQHCHHRRRLDWTPSAYYGAVLLRQI